MSPCSSLSKQEVVKIRVTSHRGLPRISSQAQQFRSRVVEKLPTPMICEAQSLWGKDSCKKCSPDPTKTWQGEGPRFLVTILTWCLHHVLDQVQNAGCLQELERSHPSSKLTGGHLSPSGLRQVQSAPGPCGSCRRLWPLWKGSQPCVRHFSVL